MQRVDEMSQERRNESWSGSFWGGIAPLLTSVADYLWERYVVEGVWELSGVILVLPGARAGRKLSEALVDRAQGEQVPLFPPVVTTVGHLPELLYQCRRPFATPLTQQLAWTEALRQTSPGVLGQFLRGIPSADDDPHWWELGGLLWRQHRELAADGLDFPHVADSGAELPSFVDQARWQALCAFSKPTCGDLMNWDFGIGKRHAWSRLNMASADRNAISSSSAPLT